MSEHQTQTEQHLAPETPGRVDDSLETFAFSGTRESLRRSREARRKYQPQAGGPLSRAHEVLEAALDDFFDERLTRKEAAAYRGVADTTITRRLERAGRDTSQIGRDERCITRIELFGRPGTD